METNIDALWKTFELSRNDNTSKSSSVFYFSYDMIEKTIRLIIFVGRNELLEKQIKAKRCKWHSCQIITSKSGNSPKVLCIRHKQELSRLHKKFGILCFPSSFSLSASHTACRPKGLSFYGFRMPYTKNIHIKSPFCLYLVNLTLLLCVYF